MIGHSAAPEPTQSPSPKHEARGVSVRTATRLAWSLWAACVVLIGLALLLDFATPESFPFRTGERPGPVLAVLTGVLSLAFPTVGALIASRLPANPIGWIFCGMGLLLEMQRFTTAYADYTLLGNPAFPGGEYVAWFTTWLGLSGPVLAGVFLTLLFPNGRLLSRRWRIVAWAAIFGAALTALGDALMPGQLRTHQYVENPFGVVGVIGDRFTTYEVFAASIVLGTTLLAMSTLIALFSLILRLHRAGGEERQQLKWFLYAAVPAVVSLSPFLLDAMLVNFTTNFVGNPRYIGSHEFLTYSIYVAVCASLMVPVFTYIAILRYRLYDIDLIINRTLVYGTLSACVVGLYVLVVGGAGALFQVRGSFVVSLLAVGLVAVVFQPLRNRLQRGVNRLVYGERDEPYKVLSRLGQRLEATLAPEEALSTIVETVTQALKLPYAAITLEQDGRFVTAAEHGSPVGKLVTLPLVYHAEEVGRLVVAPRAPGEAFASADRRLLDDLAHQAGAAAHAARLTADLQRSRERLVTAREEERRRLRRDLHDGVGPQLAALMLELETAGDLVSGDPEASALMAKLSQRTRETVADVRRSVHALRPPALDELGLIGALREGAARYSSRGLRVSVEAPEELPHLPAAVEVACYRIVQEALTNVVRHAGASNCRVRIGLDEERLSVEVEDDGRGIREDDSAGVGMSSMRERAEELGGSCSVGPSAQGGTLVSAILPCRTADGTGRGEE